MQNQQQIEVIITQIKVETEQYFEAITREKDLTLARNIKFKIMNLQRLLDSTMQMNNLAMAS